MHIKSTFITIFETTVHCHYLRGSPLVNRTGKCAMVYKIASFYCCSVNSFVYYISERGSSHTYTHLKSADGSQRASLCSLYFLTLIKSRVAGVLQFVTFFENSCLRILRSDRVSRSPNPLDDGRCLFVKNFFEIVRSRYLRFVTLF